MDFKNIDELSAELKSMRPLNAPKIVAAIDEVLYGRTKGAD